MPAVGRLRWYRAGGIVALIGILREHRGPVGGDLARAHFTWDDVGGERLPFTQFSQMVVHSPPGTAVFYAMHEGWTRDTHKLTQLVDLAKWLVWAKTEDGHENRNRPEPEWRPGDPIPEQQPTTTIRDYMRLVGMEGADDD